MLDITLQQRLRREVEGETQFDHFSRGRYATDASIYQIMPAGVIVPKRSEDIAAALDAASQAGVPLTMRGGGTSQCGQTVNSGLIVDCSRYFNRIIDLDIVGRRAVVEPGIVLDDLNRILKPHGLWFPVDVSTASRATIGGMVGNNSCGARSLRYGTTRDNVERIEGFLADGTSFDFGREPGNRVPEALLRQMLEIGAREADEIAARFPKVQRRVGGYNIDALIPDAAPINLAHLLIGSEGTLAISTAIEIKLSPLPSATRVLGVCHFPTFRAAMEAAKPMVGLNPTSVELVDSTMIELARAIPLYATTLEKFVRGVPAAMLLVEFADSPTENQQNMQRLADTMSDLGYGFGRGGAHEGGVVEIWDMALAAEIGELRKGGLNIMMSMKDEGKPVSFVEDCAVPLEHLADYTDRLSDVFRSHGTTGTWYAHASEGCLHVRPVLNLKQEKDVRAMREIAEAAFAMVREYKGSHSGEHGDGIVRSEFHGAMFGARILAAFEQVKAAFDPDDRLNPGKIVHAPKMDDRTLMRYAPDYTFTDLKTGHDWSAWPGKSGGLQGAIEMCNNNGACRKLKGGAMCPSYRVTRDERDVTRGRANTLRLALSGRLGKDALHSDAMAATMRLCVGCKACKTECPTGVDMARMKTEVLYQRGQKSGFGLRERLIATMPRYARLAVALRGLVMLRNRVPALAALGERLMGFAKDRSLPQFRADFFRDAEVAQNRPSAAGSKVILFTDTFNRWMEPEIPRAALRVLVRAGYDVITVSGAGRPLCCGRTYLAAGMIDQARAEARRTLDALIPHIRSGVPVIGLEPSCLLTLRDEFLTLLPGEDARHLSENAYLLEEFIARESRAGRFDLPMQDQGAVAHVHGHCHQKAAGVMGDMGYALSLIPGLDAQNIESSCCGMAGAFGYQAETVDISKQMGELSLLPAVRAAAAQDIVIANGTSCRHQISDGTGRQAEHIAQVFDRASKNA